jgi:hypothetical protein
MPRPSVTPPKTTDYVQRTSGYAPELSLAAGPFAGHTGYRERHGIFVPGRSRWPRPGLTMASYALALGHSHGLIPWPRKGPGHALP